MDEFLCELYLIDDMEKVGEEQISLQSNPALAQRKRQVYGESVPGTVTPTGNYLVTQMAIQDHRALKAGPHFDVRFNVKGRGVSFVTRTGFPTQPGEVRRLIRTPDHRVEYMNWEGEIPYGKYGGGTVRLHDKQDVVLKSDPEKITLDIHDGPNKGSYAIFKNLKDWFMAKRVELPTNHFDKEKFQTLNKIEDLQNPDDYIAMRKMDGAHFIATITKSGTSFVSAAKSKDGGIITRQYNVPHLRDAKSKKFDGMVVRGELWHPNGFNVLSGILNSNPKKAVQDQFVLGHVRFAPFDIVSLPGGKDASDLPYAAKLQLLKEVTGDMKSNFIQLPETAETPEEKSALAAKLLGNPRAEGMIFRHATDPKAPGLKLKNWFDYDLKVVDVTPGQGMFEGGVGALVLADKTGRTVGKVGAGLTNMLRMDLGKYPSQIIGKVVRVKTMEPLVDQLRAPKFVGLAAKDEPDELIKRPDTSGVDKIEKTSTINAEARMAAMKAASEKLASQMSEEDNMAEQEMIKKAKFKDDYGDETEVEVTEKGYVLPELPNPENEPLVKRAHTILLREAFENRAKKNIPETEPAFDETDFFRGMW